MKQLNHLITPSNVVAVFVLAVGILCFLLQSSVPSLGAWPKEWTIPTTEIVGGFLEWVFGVLKPTARIFSGILEFPMFWVNWLLTTTPWPLTIGLTIALGWHTGGWRMATLAAVGLGFVLCSGYWDEGMNTLALVFVSVPLALMLGLTIGVLAIEYKIVKNIIEATLDFMQTVPTFAYLTPLLLLFGFGPVVGLVASAIYAAPPMARNTMLGLERVDSEIKEAAIMSGGTRWQQLLLVELPAARTQIMIGVNQCLMAALSMVIIAAVIGGFNDIGWEVLLTMRKAQFGQAFLAGSVIVIFAILIDRISGAFAVKREIYNPKISYAIIALAVAISVMSYGMLPDASTLAIFDGVAGAVDETVGTFTSSYGAALDQIKNGAMFYVLLPMKIGLSDAVLPFTWGFQWTMTMTVILCVITLLAAGILVYRGRLNAGVFLLLLVFVFFVGITQLPWPFVILGFTALGWVAGGRKLMLMIVIFLGLIMISGLWDRALLSIYLCVASVAACVFLGGSLGLLASISKPAWTVLRTVCDILQTIPLFVFLIPVLMFFQIGEFSAFIAICAYAIVPMIRYTHHGLTHTPPELIESATASGATPWQMLWEIRFPYAAPTILLGLNQTILYAFAMLVIAALIGTTGLGQSIFLALGKADIGLGISSGIAMAFLAMIADRLVQGFANEKRAALGLN